ncbi:hypothetical protein IY71_04770 [Brucella suis]|uniref:Uncharacterized protein n=1 Tax=Brucella suis TaxID=29461 RepID=A0AAU8QN19_BRUSS|nr:hypothetical protein [Brucella suis]AIN84207.1 hypothetical protein IY71_04770 [Brucella suis]AIN87249.1 hypothetical protein IY72_04510 [Brucella suis]
MQFSKKLRANGKIGARCRAAVCSAAALGLATSVLLPPVQAQAANSLLELFQQRRKPLYAPFRPFSSA